MADPLPPKGAFQVVIEQRRSRTIDRIEAEGPISLKSWPLPEQGPPDDRPKQLAGKRMLWRRDGSLAYRPQDMVPIEDLPHLISEDEFLGRTER